MTQQSEADDAHDPQGLVGLAGDQSGQTEPDGHDQLGERCLELAWKRQPHPEPHQVGASGAHHPRDEPEADQDLDSTPAARVGAQLAHTPEV